MLEVGPECAYGVRADELLLGTRSSTQEAGHVTGPSNDVFPIGHGHADDVEDCQQWQVVGIVLDEIGRAAVEGDHEPGGASGHCFSPAVPDVVICLRDESC